jgi:hypothetical protein
MNNKSWNIKEIPASLTLLASAMQHKKKTVIMWMIILTTAFCSLTKSYWTAYALQTNNKYMFSFEYDKHHILVSISNCSWYEFQMKILNCTFEYYTSAQFMNICVNKTYALKRKHILTWGIELANVIFASMLVFNLSNLPTSKYIGPSEIWSSPSFCHGT